MIHPTPSSLFRLVFITLLLSGPLALGADHPAPTKGLKHVVCLKFNEDAAPEEIEAITRAALNFPKTILEVKHVEGGENVSFEGKDKGFTHCFVMTFENKAGLEAYLPHPAHTAVVERIKPILADVFVVDYRVE